MGISRFSIHPQCDTGNGCFDRPCGACNPGGSCATAGDKHRFIIQIRHSKAVTNPLENILRNANQVDRFYNRRAVRDVRSRNSVLSSYAGIPAMRKLR